MPTRLFGMQNERHGSDPRRHPVQCTFRPAPARFLTQPKRMTPRSPSPSRPKTARAVAGAVPSRDEDSSLASDIAKRMEEEILRGRVRPGTRLDERELSERYKVSRTPVREALQRLSASGLAVARGLKGLQVAQMSVADLLDALSVVAELEALACVQAARRITADQRKLLQKAHEACGRAAARGDADAFYDANIDFHDAIAVASHNRVLQDELRRLSLKTAPYRRTITFQPGSMVSSQAEHEAVLKAILANDPTGAGTLMRSHVGMLSEGIADFLHFVRRSEHSGLFLENP
jgi:DNA-binding GntR family transcriptional regulator